jgi:metal-responsive CopG/Arc/MetJ family transcriptional regulator
MKKILVSLPDGVVETLDNELIGKVGQTRSDTSHDNYELAFRTRVSCERWEK